MKTLHLAALAAALTAVPSSAQDTDSTGLDILAADLLGNRIVRITWPAPGAGEPTISTLIADASGATAIAPHPSGLVTCADVLTGRLVICSADGGQRTLVEGLGRPRSLRALPDGHLLLADEGDRRVVEFGRDGKVVAERRGEFAPWDAIRTADGGTLIADATTRGLLEIDAEGVTVWTRPNLGRVTRVQEVDGGNLLAVLPDDGKVIELGRDGRVVATLEDLTRPQDALRLADGRTLVALQGAVREFDSNGDPTGRQALVGLPVALARVGAKAASVPHEPGSIWIADYSENAIFAVDANGEEFYQLNNVYGCWDVEPLANGNLLITQFALSRVVEKTRGGEQVWSYEELRNPYDADRLANGNTLIADTFGQRVIEVSPAGDVVWSYSDDVKPYDCERLANGNTLIADGDNERVLEVNAEGEVVWEVRSLPSAHDADRLPNGNTLITQRTKHRTIEIDSNGEIVWSVERLSSPSDADRLPDGTTIIAENGAVRVFDAEGHELRKIPVSWAVEVNVVPTAAPRASGR